MMENPNPQTLVVNLSLEQKRAVDDALRALQGLGPLQQKMIDCGIACDGYESLRQQLIGNLLAVKQHFGNRDPINLS